MICEKFQFDFNIQSIFEGLAPLIQKHVPFQRSPAVSGWSVQGHSGCYKDGWPLGFCPYNGPHNLGPSWNPKNSSEKGLVAIQQFTQPTNFFTPDIHFVIKRLEELGLNPRRGRVIKIPPHSQTVWHQDGNKNIYQARLHIPLVTNPHCFFETEHGRCHMPADGSGYFVHINQFHRAMNNGDQDRYHLVFHIWDQTKITQNHQYDMQKYNFEADHPDAVDLKTLVKT